MEPCPARIYAQSTDSLRHALRKRLARERRDVRAIFFSSNAFKVCHLPRRVCTCVISLLPASRLHGKCRRGQPHFTFPIESHGRRQLPHACKVYMRNYERGKSRHALPGLPPKSRPQNPCVPQFLCAPRFPPWGSLAFKSPVHYIIQIFVPCPSRYSYPLALSFTIIVSRPSR